MEHDPQALNLSPVDSTLSDPARSTRLMTAALAISLPAEFLLFWMKWTPTMVWAREEVAFMLVEATVRLTVPSSILDVMSSYEETIVSFRPSAAGKRKEEKKWCIYVRK